MYKLASFRSYSRLLSDVSECKRERFVLFLLIAALMLLYALGPNPPRYFSGDAEHYWNLGKTFFKNGGFSLYNYESTFRGYSLPLILGLIQFLAAALGIDEFVLFQFVNAAVTAGALVYLVPSLTCRIFSVPATVTGIVVLNVLFVTFWGGFLIYPLSDTWSFFLVALAVLAAIKALESEIRSNAALLGLLAGFAVALCLNIRPIYALSFPFLLAAIVLVSRASHKRKVTVVLPFALGSLLVLAPQSLLNLSQIGTLNPLSHSGSLYVMQIFAGTAVQRHECAYFLDTAGITLLASSGISALHPAPGGAVYFDVSVSDRSIIEYVKLVIAHPLDFAALYLRHIVNGLTIARSNIYACIYRPYDVAISFLSILIVGIVFAYALIAPSFVRHMRHKMFLISTIAPLLVLIPTAIESRFFFPAQIWFYAVLAFVILRQSALALVREHLAAFLGIICLVFAVGAVQFADVQSEMYSWHGIETGRAKIQASPQLITR